MSKEWHERSFRLLQIRRGREPQDLPEMPGLRLITNGKTRKRGCSRSSTNLDLKRSGVCNGIKSSDERAPSEKRPKRQNCGVTRNAFAYFSIGIELTLRGR
jgi:hypothetical protein